jgi:hypothetical protein
VRRLLPVLLPALLIGCPPGVSAPECDEADGERYVRFDPAGGVQAPPPDDAPLTGTFTEWAAGEVSFEDDAGQAYGFEVVVDGDVALPDLPVGEPVELTVYGFNPAPGDQSEPVFHVLDSAGQTLLITGNVERFAALDGWTVRSPRDEQTCRPEMQDGSPHRFKPVFIAHLGDELELFAGDTAVLDGMRIEVITAESNNRNHPSAPCSNEDCPWEKLAWWVVPAGPG